MAPPLLPSLYLSVSLSRCLLLFSIPYYSVWSSSLIPCHFLFLYAWSPWSFCFYSEIFVRLCVSVCISLSLCLSPPLCFSGLLFLIPPPHFSISLRPHPPVSLSYIGVSLPASRPFCTNLSVCLSVSVSCLPLSIPYLLHLPPFFTQSSHHVEGERRAQPELLRAG